MDPVPLFAKDSRRPLFREGFAYMQSSLFAKNRGAAATGRTLAGRWRRAIVPIPLIGREPAGALACKKTLCPFFVSSRRATRRAAAATASGALVLAARVIRVQSEVFRSSRRVQLSRSPSNSIARAARRGRPG